MASQTDKDSLVVKRALYFSQERASTKVLSEKRKTDGAAGNCL